MTDNDIINALECCAQEYYCAACPLIGTRKCIPQMSENAINLINRQKAEIERLTVELKAMRGAANSYKMHYNHAIKEFAERLKNYLKEHAWIWCSEVDNLVKEMTEGKCV